MLFKTSKLGIIFGYVLSPTSEELIAFSPTKRHFNLLQCVPSWYKYDKLGVVIETFYSKMPSKCTRNVVGPLSKDIKKIRNLFTSFILKNPQIYH